jgi:hypothetical protein
MVVSDRTKGCCSSDLNEPSHPNHDQFAELDAHNLKSFTTEASEAPVCGVAMKTVSRVFSAIRRQPRSEHSFDVRSISFAMIPPRL